MDIQSDRLNNFSLAQVITVISLVLGLLFDYFFYDKIPGISFPLYVILVIEGLFIISKFLKMQINKEVYMLLVLLLFFSTMVFVHFSGLLIFLNILASLLLLLIIAEIFFSEKVRNFSVEDYIKIFFLPLKFFHPFFQTLSDLFSICGEKDDRKVFSQIVKGVLIAIPVLFVFLLLFSSADFIFKKYVLDLISIDNELEIIFRFILILIVTVVFIGAYTYSFREKEDQNGTYESLTLTPR